MSETLSFPSHSQDLIGKQPNTWGLLVALKGQRISGAMWDQDVEQPYLLIVFDNGWGLKLMSVANTTIPSFTAVPPEKVKRIVESRKKLLGRLTSELEQMVELAGKKP